VHPDVLIIQGPTLPHQVNAFEGAGPDVVLLINSPRPADELGIAEFTGKLQPRSVRTVPATDLAQQHVGRPVPVWSRSKGRARAGRTPALVHGRVRWGRLD
jgi:pyruvate ferredoxin oxidoreductase gamma subunit